ncbi:UNVERIFIED_CONTAM: hypothetical protein NCL1_52494 [Trichonephila clavipes]
MEGYEEQSECCPTQLLLLKRIRNFAAKKGSTFPACDDFQYAYSVRLHILHGSYSVFGYPNGVRSQLIRMNDVLLYKQRSPFDAPIP